VVNYCTKEQKQTKRLAAQQDEGRLLVAKLKQQQQQQAKAAKAATKLQHLAE